MHRVLFEIGSFKVHSFGVLVLLGFLAALLWARKRAPKFGLTPADVSDAAFWTLLLGVLGARVGFILQDVPYYLNHPNQLWTLQFEGLTSFGGLIAGGAYLAWFAKRRGKPIAALFDLAGPPMLLAHAIGRVGCLLNGCCFGGETSLPWAVGFEGRVGLYHPAQIYDSLMTLAALGLLMAFERRGLKPWQPFALSIGSYGLVRFAYEFWRAGVSSTYFGSLPITDAQVAALGMALLGAWIFWRSERSKPVTQSAPAGKA